MRYGRSSMVALILGSILGADPSGGQESNASVSNPPVRLAVAPDTTTKTSIPAPAPAVVVPAPSSGFLTAAVTRVSGGLGTTSEFSNCVPITIVP